jgi:hypothetical protein
MSLSLRFLTHDATENELSRAYVASNSKRRASEDELVGYVKLNFANPK